MVRACLVRRVHRPFQRVEAAGPVREGRWRVDLPPLYRLMAGKVERPKIGGMVGVIGFAGPLVTGTPTMRAELLFVSDSVYPMRSDLCVRPVDLGSSANRTRPRSSRR